MSDSEVSQPVTVAWRAQGPAPGPVSAPSPTQAAVDAQDHVAVVGGHHIGPAHQLLAQVIRADLMLQGDASLMQSPYIGQAGYIKGMRDRSDVSYMRPLVLDGAVERL